MEFLIRRDDERVALLAPDAGIFTRALQTGSALAPGQPGGTLLRLGRATELVVPAGVRGVIVSERPELVHMPVGHGDELYELAPFDAQGGMVAVEQDAAVGDGLYLNASQTGRFYARPQPDVDPFVSVGTVLENGAPVGLIEVMKQFTRIVYQATGNLPARARVVRVLVEDSEDVERGAPLIEVEEA